MIDWHYLSADTITSSHEGYRLHVYEIDVNKWRWCIVWSGKPVRSGTEMTPEGAMAQCETQIKSL